MRETIVPHFDGLYASADTANLGSLAEATQKSFDVLNVNFADPISTFKRHCADAQRQRDRFHVFFVRSGRNRGEIDRIGIEGCTAQLHAKAWRRADPPERPGKRRELGRHRRPAV
ncbi:hypothetical protein RX329_36710 [Bradyrhizobium sp. BWC-3-1]|nr:hypothetical protein [Bradyrhizobium sp. BWC-3-1]WOH62846.1 hypothetical protein RX329_36710 [Bradyrhizobium sp. BWC-3-1]